VKIFYEVWQLVKIDPVYLVMLDALPETLFLGQMLRYRERHAHEYKI
jgi:hypothetical protein